MTTRLFCLLMIFLLTMFCALNDVRSASNERLDGRCRRLAEFARDMHRDLQAGVIVNVMPRDEPMLDFVKEHKGTEKELYDKVIGKCMGVET